jgi:hypothetical protein
LDEGVAMARRRPRRRVSRRGGAHNMGRVGPLRQSVRPGPSCQNTNAPSPTWPTAPTSPHPLGTPNTPNTPNITHCPRHRKRPGHSTVTAMSNPPSQHTKLFSCISPRPSHSHPDTLTPSREVFCGAFCINHGGPVASLRCNHSQHILYSITQIQSSAHTLFTPFSRPII